MSLPTFYNAVVTATKSEISIKHNGEEIFNTYGVSSFGQRFIKAVYLLAISQKDVEYDGADFVGMQTVTEITRIPLKCELTYSNFSFQISVCHENEDWSEPQPISINSLLSNDNIFPEGYDVTEKLIIYDI